jgi:2-(1,2-epoxy-1,2-dihydrophenyl)acetyl-CoA isomerase
MKFNTILFDVDAKGIATITLNRPNEGNAYNQEMADEFMAALAEVESNPDIKVLVTTGYGDRFFCGGGDMGMLSAIPSAAEAIECYKESGKMIPALYQLNKPSIAAVNGIASGAGTALALAHDIVLAADNARFGTNFITIAFTPDSGASYFLSKATNRHRMAEMMYTGKVIDAQQAYEWGFFNHVYPRDSFKDEVYSMAARIAQNPPLTLRYDKDLLREAFKNDFYTQLELETIYNAVCWTTEDFREGIRAAMAKMRGERITPNFKGK